MIFFIAKNVFLINCNEDTMPHSQSKETNLEEERRLFYVALTRSKNYTYLLVPKNNPSIFITEIKKYGKEYIEEINL